VIQPGNGIIYARLTAGIAGLDEGEYIEGHCLDATTSARVPKNMIGRRLSARQAKKLLDGLDAGTGGGTRKVRCKKRPAMSTA
jgi:hypothetical protein